MKLASRWQTERLVLRCWTGDDAEALRAAIDASAAELRPWIPFMRHEPRTLEETRAWVRARIEDHESGIRHFYAVTHEEVLVGEVMLLNGTPIEVPELGYWIHSHHTRRGYAAEACRRLMAEAVRAGAVALELRCSSGNEASLALARTLGFAHVGTEPQSFESPAGGMHDTETWRFEPGSTSD